MQAEPSPKKPLGKLFLGVLVLALAALVAYLFLAAPEQSGRRNFGSRAVSVIVQSAELKEFSDIVEAIGTLKAQESVMLTPSVSDTIKKIHFDDGQAVLRGDLLVELMDDEERAQLNEAEANVTEANLQYERIKELTERGSATASALDEQIRRRNEVRSRLAVARARIADRQIRAPFDGVLGLREVSEGSLVTTQTAITTIDAVQIMNLDFDVPERFLSTLKKGLQVVARVEAYEGQDFVGTVRTVGSRVDPATRLVTVRAEVDNKDMILRPGMLMTVRLIARSWQAVSVPEEAIIPTGGIAYVFVIKDDVAERRRVELGIRRPGYVEVTTGLDADDLIVTEGAFRLGRGGVKVSPRNPDGRPLATGAVQ